MAKKTLTPEQAEIKAMKKAKRSQNWTKFWAIFLAAVLTVGVVFLGKTQADNAIKAAGTVQGGEETPGTQTPGTQTPGTQTPGTQTPDVQTPDTQTPDTQTPDTQTPGTQTPGTQTPGTQTPNAPAADDRKTVADAINAATKKAAEGSYEMERVCEFQDGKGIKVSMFGGDATSVLNGVITAVDPNANLNSVVGGFLGRGTKKIKVTNGVGQRYGSDGTMAELTAEEKDYLLKATNLTANDLASATKNGNVYTFTLANISDPQKDSKNAMHKATNDFITEAQVKTAIGGLTSAITVQSANVTYYNVQFQATIENGNLKKLTMSYKADAVMKLKVALTIDGSGSLEVNTTYTF